MAALPRKTLKLPLPLWGRGKQAPALRLFPPLLIAPPILLVVGENAHSRYHSKDVYQAASKPKELVIVPNADHVDLYDRMDKIPFDKLTSFFRRHLA
jgi:fermentation-respiration switch protein FrsA (DUF1100 family)